MAELTDVKKMADACCAAERQATCCEPGALER
jgi:hypothetical protein